MDTKPTQPLPPDQAHRLHAFIDSRGRVLPGVICDRCGYDLRGQPSAGQCPECGDAISPMLYAMVMADIRRPWFLLAVISSVGLALLCLLVSYAINYQTSNFDPPRVDWFVVMQLAMAGTTFCALVAGVLAGLCEYLHKPGLMVASGVTALGLLMATLLLFMFVILIATP